MSQEITSSKFYKVRNVDYEDKNIPINEIRVTGRSTANRIIGRARHLFKEKEQQTIVLKAAGVAIPTLCIATEIIRRRIANLHQWVQLKTISVNDQFTPKEEGLDAVTIERKLTVLEVTLSTNPAELQQDLAGYNVPVDQKEVIEFDSEQLKQRESHDNEHSPGVRARGRGRGGFRGQRRGYGEFGGHRGDRGGFRGERRGFRGERRGFRGERGVRRFNGGRRGGRDFRGGRDNDQGGHDYNDRSRSGDRRDRGGDNLRVRTRGYGRGGRRGGRGQYSPGRSPNQRSPHQRSPHQRQDSPKFRNDRSPNENRYHEDNRQYHQPRGDNRPRGGDFGGRRARGSRGDGERRPRGNRRGDYQH